MAKKKTVKKVEEEISYTAEEAVPNGVVESTFAAKDAINPLSIDTGREDLNNVVSKVNEIIEFINKR